MNLIYDRTPADVQEVSRLSALGFASMTASERNKWLAGMKGAYNHTDLNRVEKAVETLMNYFNGLQNGLDEYAASLDVAIDPLFQSGIGGIALTVKTDWTALSVPTEELLARYLNNVVSITDVIEIEKSLPASMDRLGWQSANNIEKALHDVYEAGLELEAHLRTLIYNAAQAWYYSDDIYSGEVE